MSRQSALFAMLLALSGCTDGGDADAGSADCSADTDGDYLNDCEEQELGTDPKLLDSDGDSYADGDEVLENKDPLDPTSRIYTGYWPYQRFKSELSDPGFSGAPAVAARVPRLVALDQYGEQVDLFDFARHGKPVVIDLSAVWCEACKDLALWLDGEPSSLDATAELASVIDRVAAGEIFWVTVLFEDRLGNPATLEDAKGWAEAFPNPKVAVLVDDNRALRDWFFPGTMPSVHATDEELNLLAYDRFDYKVALSILAQ